MNRSTLPQTSQDGPHPRLAEIVARHLTAPWQQPIRTHSKQAFAQLAQRLTPNRPIILDSGCGTGHSTARLAALHPDWEVVGVDQSAARLGRSPSLPKNAHLVRAELADFWRLARQAGWVLRQHYLLHPNPWPKASQFRRRWHGHPVWPDMLALGGGLELRTNFQLYAEEFALALELAGFRADLQMLSLTVEQAISPFERKYLASGHQIFCVRSHL